MNSGDIDVTHKVCATCLVDKSLSMFAHQKGCTDGHRAQCRECYNAGRRAHYARPNVNEKKNEIRRIYNSKPEIVALRKEYRNSPERKVVDRATRIKYKAKPDVKERILARRAQFEAMPVVRARMVLQAALARANKCSLPFDLTLEWVAERILAGRCEVTEIPFDFSKSKHTRRNPFAPSVDQIVAGTGYTKQNCRVVLVALNLALAEWGLAQFLYIARHALELNGFCVSDGKELVAA